MASETPRRIPEDTAATREEIDHAIETLTSGQLLRLHKFAAWRIRGLGRTSPWHEADDLLNDAIASTLAGAEGPGEGRHWNKRVDFVKHLTGAMRSMTHHQKRKGVEEDDTQLESDLITADPEGKESSPLDSARSKDPPADRVLFAKEEVARVFKIVEGDDEGILILQGWAEGMTGTEIMGLGFTKQQYEAAVKRIRYAVRGRTHGGQSHAE